MLDQRISEKTFLRLTTQKEIINFKLGRNKDDYLKSFKPVVEVINSEGHDFKDVISFCINGKIAYKTLSIASFYLSKYINKLLKKIYKVKQANRDNITKQINLLINDESPYTIFKCDIAEFYESINKSILVSKIDSDRILSSSNVDLIKRMFTHLDSLGVNGLPRGISFSSTLSELYMRSFDEFMRTLPGVYYYARYVDDFIFFTHNNNVSLRIIEEELNKIGLKLNKDKTKKIKSSLLRSNTRKINFLGYEHGCSSNSGATIKISNKRIRKLKTRIILAFLDFIKNSDEDLFKKRMQFVTGNYIITQRDKKNLLAGFYYNNISINYFDQIKELDRFLMKICTSQKGFYSKAITSVKRVRIYNICRKYTFENGYKRRVAYILNIGELNVLKSCWEREHIYEK